VKRFFDLKISWSFRPQDFNRHGNYFFKDALYPRKDIPYSSFNTPVSNLDAIFKSLGSEFRSRSEIDEAERILSNLINDAARALTV
jgi:hypothetical protein